MLTPLHIIIGCGGGGRGVRQAGGGGAVQRGDAAAAPPPAPAPARLLDPEGEGAERLGPRRQELQTTLQEQEIQVSLCSVKILQTLSWTTTNYKSPEITFNFTLYLN